MRAWRNGLRQVRRHRTGTLSRLAAIALATGAGVGASVAGAGLPAQSRAATGTAAPALLIADVNVIDGTAGPSLRHSDVWVVGGRIAAVLPHGGRLPGPRRRNFVRLDGRDRYLVPGFIDAHVHLVGGAFRRGAGSAAASTPDERAAIRALQGYLYAGFTTVYDAGNDGPFILELRRRQRAGDFPSPRLLATGFYLTAEGGRGAGGPARIGTPLHEGAAAQADLDRQLAAAPDLQKFMYEPQGIGPMPLVPALQREALRQAIGFFHAHGIRSTIHASTEAAAREALDAGVDSFAHVPAAGVLTPEFVRLVADRRIPLATTLVVFDDIIRLGQGAEYLRDASFTQLIEPAELEDRAAARALYRGMGWPAWFEALMPYLRRNVKALDAAGAVLALGTDKSFAPYAWREMQLLAAAGIEPSHILRMATLDAARYLGMEPELGSIAVGKRADLVLLGADPTVDITNVQRVEAVIQDGRVIDRRSLDVPANAGKAARQLQMP